jgi:hypothetical protein
MCPDYYFSESLVHRLCCSRMFLGPFPSVVYPCQNTTTRAIPGLLARPKEFTSKLWLSFPPQISVKTRRQQMHYCVGCWWEARKQGGREGQWELIRIDRPLCTSNKREGDITAGRGVLVPLLVHTFTFPSTSSHSPPSQ